MDNNNLFINILKKARENNWCTKYFCTTCGAREFRKELVFQGGNNKKDLLASLESIYDSELIEIEGWCDALKIAFYDLSMSSRSELLREWLKVSNEKIRFIDVILFHFVRYLKLDEDLYHLWIEKCLDVARRTYDFSLIESLALVLENDLNKYTEIYQQAVKYAESSSQMRRVLINTNNL